MNAGDGEIQISRDGKIVAVDEFIPARDAADTKAAEMVFLIMAKTLVDSGLAAIRDGGWVKTEVKHSKAGTPLGEVDVRKYEIQINHYPQRMVPR